MTRSFFDNGDLPAVMTDGQPNASASSAVAGGRHAHGVAAARATSVRSPQELDYRLRGLSLDPTGYVPTAPTRPERQRRRPRRRGPLLVKAAMLLGVAALATWLVQAFAVQPFSVPGMAMAPTFQPGDRILVVKSGPLTGPVHSGQIVVFRPPRFLPCTAGGGGGDLVLRVIALPGQTIWSVDRTIFVDGRPLHERGWYDRRSGQVGSRPIPSTTLAPDQYYVLGDQRSGACDSRVFGPISKSSIVGDAIAIVVRHSHVFLRRL
jgi:signal peptidase I